MPELQTYRRQNRYDNNSKLLSGRSMDKDNQPVPHEHLEKMIALVANQRDKQAFGVLFKFFMPKIRSFGMQKLGHQGLAMDLVQETMQNIWTKSHLYNGDKGAVTTWVYTIMRNRCFDMLRKIQHNREDTFGDDIWPIFESDESIDTQQDNDPLMSNLLMQHLEQLPLAQRQVVKGIYLQELSQQELAEKLNIPLGTVKSRLRLGLEKLKSFLEKHHD
ncbi:sigma-70 family RNA polymerase sigma factor [Shewanella gelidii]|uniref:RNA polymerase sigma factor ECF family 11 n=1 Tax=Shewanella gelidii TaxID=1642821 RepID=A0A917JM08_9GAMM|nr:sigma-70 family RNA polymerase sigma factor [Shewanella gelidii]MCL1099237.1 sigma-70 family RNA polymerase sigma factor [Shewanella gelidii]GGI76656.1 RNA polymerase sigma factor ECF family 11 [Shewanella gelidii]